MGKQNYFFSGITDILILAILCEHDSYVYEIVKFIKEKSNGCLSISQNTVYAVTYKLVNEGKISEYSKLVGKKRTRIFLKARLIIQKLKIAIFRKSKARKNARQKAAKRGFWALKASAMRL